MFNSSPLRPVSSPWLTNTEPFSSTEEKMMWSVINKATRRFSDQIPKEQLEDLVQTAGLAMVLARQNFDPAKGAKLTTVEYRYAHNAVVNALAKEGEFQKQKEQYLPNERNWEDVDDEDDQPVDWGEYLGRIDPEYEKLEKRMIAREVRKAITKLTPRQQKLVQALFWQNRSQVEVASEWGVSTSLVRKELRRVEVKLKKIYPENPFG